MKHDQKPRPWAEVIKPILARFEVSVKFKSNAVFTPDGSQAMHSLMKEMARLLDEEVERREK